MRKVGLIAAAALVAALPFTIDGAFAQGKGGISAGGGGGGGMRGGGGGGAAFAGGGGGKIGMATGGGGFRGGMGGGGFSGGPRVGFAGGGQNWAGRPSGWNGGWRGGHRRFWGPGIGFGIGTGLALGAYAASPYYYGYDDGYYYDGYPADDGVIVGETTVGPSDVASCAARYRSYDPASQTFLGYDGQRHPCP